MKILSFIFLHSLLTQNISWFLGGMRPNTLILGFYDDCIPQDNLCSDLLLSDEGVDAVCPIINSGQHLSPFFPDVRGAEEPKELREEEYVSIIADALKMGKNVILARYFNQFDRQEVLGLGKGFRDHQKVKGPFIDVWPLNLLQPGSLGYVNISSLFLLQLASVLQEVRAWKQASLRLFLCVEAGGRLQEEEELRLRSMLKELRISAQVQKVAWDNVVRLHWQRRGGEEDLVEYPQTDEERLRRQSDKDDSVQTRLSDASPTPDEYICAVNSLIFRHSSPQTAVRFLHLPHPPSDARRYRVYLHQVDLLSRDLGPTLLIHGITPVVTTDL